MSIKFNEEDRERLNDVQNCLKRKTYSFTDTLNYSTYLQKKILSDFDSSVDNINNEITSLKKYNERQYYLNLVFALLLLLLSIAIAITAFKNLM